MEESRKTIIEKQRSPFKVNFSELYQYRELLWTLTYRDLRVKYAQTVIGFLWVFLNPIFTLIILNFVFGQVAKVDTGEIPHVIYTIAGMCGWTYFQTVLSSAGNSLISSQNMIKKIYFPRLVIPLSKAITALINFGVVMLCLAIIMAALRFAPSANIIYSPFFVLMALISGLAAGIWMSALTIRFRDFQHITPMLLRLGMFITPIAYPASAVPEKYQLLFHLNPMAGVVEGMRWSLVGGDPPSQYAYISFVLITILLITGVFYFNKVERVMADIL